MNAHAQSSAVAGTVPARRGEKPKRLPMSRSRFAYLFDLTDEKEREVCRRVSFFHRGGDYTAVEFRRTISDEQRILWAVVDIVPRWRDRGMRWSVIWWNIDLGRCGFYDRRKREVADALLDSLTLR